MSPAPATLVFTPIQTIMITIPYGVFIVFGVLPNGVVLLTLLKDPRFMKEPRNLIIFVRALADGLQSATICPLPFVSTIAGRWTTGFNGCVVYAFVTSWFGLTSIQLNALMVYERWYTLSKIPLGRMSKKRLRISIILCFVAGFLASCCPLVGWSGYNYEAFGYHCSVEWHGVDWNHASFTLFLMFFFYAVPVTIIFLKGIQIFQGTRKLHRQVKLKHSGDSVLAEMTYQAQIKATRIACVMVLGFLLAWTPYGGLALYAINHKSISTITSALPSLLAKSSLIYNPCIYLFMCQRLRRKSLHTIRSFVDALTDNQQKSVGAFSENKPAKPAVFHIPNISVERLSVSSKITSHERFRMRRNAWT